MSTHADSDARPASERGADLRDAVARGALRLHYQPVVGLHECEVVGFEALLR